MSADRSCAYCGAPILPGDQVFWFDDVEPSPGLKKAPADLYCTESCMNDARRERE